jgi:hypothetical protein
VSIAGREEDRDGNMIAGIDRIVTITALKIRMQFDCGTYSSWSLMLRLQQRPAPAQERRVKFGFNVGMEHYDERGRQYEEYSRFVMIS